MAKKRGEESSFNFEQALGELEALVERMERGELTLEQSLKDFERGVELARSCQQALKEAEQKVQILLQRGDEEKLLPFEPEESSPR